MLGTREPARSPSLALLGGAGLEFTLLLWEERAHVIPTCELFEAGNSFVFPETRIMFGTR